MKRTPRAGRLSSDEKTSSPPAKQGESASATKEARNQDTKPKRRRLVMDERRAEIIAAAQRVFVERGLEGARTRDIANEADINVATLFHYFSTKDKLFEASVIEPWTELTDQAAVVSERFAVSDSMSRRELAREASRWQIDRMKKMYPLLGAALFGSRERGRTFYLEKLRPYLRQQAELVKTSIPDWQERHLDPEFLALASLALTFFLALDLDYRSDEVEPEKQAVTLSDFELFGLFGARPEDDGAD